ncbi:hypothetical protein MHAS44199_22045 [Mycolicibacterium hassiacum DSM 44199]|nr:hypothetical protein [Mycolicibacterium hassiacum DSM 44199]
MFLQLLELILQVVKKPSLFCNKSAWLVEQPDELSPLLLILIEDLVMSFLVLPVRLSQRLSPFAQLPPGPRKPLDPAAEVRQPGKSGIGGLPFPVAGRGHLVLGLILQKARVRDEGVGGGLQRGGSSTRVELFLGGGHGTVARSIDPLLRRRLVGQGRFRATWFRIGDRSHGRLAIRVLDVHAEFPIDPLVLVGCPDQHVRQPVLLCLAPFLEIGQRPRVGVEVLDRGQG